MGRQQRDVQALTARALAVVALLLAGCAAEARSERDAPTDYADVAPLVERSCLPCHAAGTHHVDLTDYEQLAAHAQLALALMKAGLMPKGNLDRSGACGDFAGPAPVSAADVELLAAFIADGMPEDDQAAAPVATPSEPFVPDVELAPDEPYLPAADAGGSGDHRCFLLRGGATQGADLRAFRVLPTQRDVVHHAMLFALDGTADAQAASELDHAAAGPGWPCFGTPGIAGARLVGVWTPGSDVVRFPQGFATHLGRAGLVAQIHYDGPAAAAPDLTRFELELAAGTSRELRFLPFAAVDLVLPPGRDVVRSAQRGWLGLAPGDELLGVFPHMHALGRRLWLRARAGDGACLAHVPDWDYTFQELALYRTPLRVSDDPELEITCEHSTRGIARTVTWGERLEDEMCMAFLAVGAAAD